MKQLTLARSELHRLANTDELTGLLNRRGFDETAEVALRSVGKAHAVAMVCDIDCFKQINDRYGQHSETTFLRLLAVYCGFSLWTMMR